MPSQLTSPLILWLDQATTDLTPLVGGKGANLGELIRAGFSVPNGFAITTTAFNQTIETNGLIDTIHSIEAGIDYSDLATLEIKAHEIQTFILNARISPDLLSHLIDAFTSLDSSLVAVRSSATMEDSIAASFAGQQNTYLNIRTGEECANAVIHCWASLYEPRTVKYRFEKGLEALPVETGVVIQTMINSEVSGVMFTLDPISGNREMVTIEAIYGLGEPLVSGEITPDLYIVEKGSGQIYKQIISEQTWMLKANDINYTPDQPNNTQISISPSTQETPKLTRTQISKLTQTAISIHNYYGMPQDIEWAICENTLYILQSRPITTLK
jgi:pyruvate,water dikinase